MKEPRLLKTIRATIHPISQEIFERNVDTMEAMIDHNCLGCALLALEIAARDFGCAPEVADKLFTISIEMNENHRYWFGKWSKHQ